MFFVGSITPSPSYYSDKQHRFSSTPCRWCTRNQTLQHSAVRKCWQATHTALYTHTVSLETLGFPAHKPRFFLFDSWYSDRSTDNLVPGKPHHHLILPLMFTILHCLSHASILRGTILVNVNIVTEVLSISTTFPSPFIIQLTIPHAKSWRSTCFYLLIILQANGLLLSQF